MNHNVIIVIALIIVVISMLAMLIRVVLGPSLADRVGRIRCDWSSINGSYSIIQYFIKY